MEQQPIVISLAPHKKKAMSGEKASIVKKAGHSNETDFATLVDGKVIDGHGKTDVSKNGSNFSLKKVCKRIQVALYSRKSKYWALSSPSAMMCKDILSIYPSSFDEYNQNKSVVKSLLREKMVALKAHLSEPNNLKEYLSLVFTNSGEVHYIVMRDGDKQYVFDAEEVIDTIVKHAKIENSKARKLGDTPEQKTLITIPHGKNYKNLLELEIRNSSQGHYAEFLCVCNRDPLFNLLKKNIPNETIFNDTLVVRGAALTDFEKKIFAFNDLPL